MYKIDIKKLVDSKYDKLNKFAVAIHISYNAAEKLYNGTTSRIEFDTLEALCKEFNCTPNDIIAEQICNEFIPISTTQAQNSRRRTRERIEMQEQQKNHEKKIQAYKDIINTISTGQGSKLPSQTQQKMAYVTLLQEKFSNSINELQRQYTKTISEIDECIDEFIVFNNEYKQISDNDKKSDSGDAK